MPIRNYANLCLKNDSFVNFELMFEKIRNKIERKRYSRRFLWKAVVAAKDFLWFIFKFIPDKIKIVRDGFHSGIKGSKKYFKRFIIKVIWENKAELVRNNSFKAKFFNFLSDGIGLIEFFGKDLCVIVGGGLGLPESGEFYAAQGYFLEYFPKNGDVAIDAGAFNGLIAIVLSLIVGKNGRVVAFEPCPENFESLKSNIKKYRIKNIILINKGIFSKNGKLSFCGSGLSGSFLNKDSGKSCIVAETVCLDDELKKIGLEKVDFIKMDIESSEIEAVKGAAKTLKNNDVKLSIASYHILNGKPAHMELEKVLKRLGYESKTGFEKHLITYAKKSYR